MAFIGSKNLKILLENESVILPLNTSHIKNGAYELSLGSQVFLTDSDPKKVSNLEQGEQITLMPGQFALLLTEETVHVPSDKMAFISIKASVKYKGLVNVSGFHVDAGFKGKLLFSVFNAGSSKIILSRGSQYFPIWFAQLDTAQFYHGKHEHQFRIPDEPVEDLSQGDLASPASLNIKIDKNHDAVMKEISLLDKDQKARIYLAGVALSIAIAILLKLGFDWNFATSAINREYEMRQNLLIEDSINKDLLIQKKQLLMDIDSLKNDVQAKSKSATDTTSHNNEFEK